MSKSNTLKSKKPLILMTMGTHEKGGHDYQVMTHKYMKPIVQFSDCVPLLVPTCFGIDNLEEYLNLADGIYLTGAGSNIDPSLYNQKNETPNKRQDPDRDNFDIPLIKTAINKNIPILGICRGMQEINVALGGDIYQKVHEEPGFHDHRENPNDTPEKQYSQVHNVNVVKNTWLHNLIGDKTFVNSLHGQGIKNLGKDLEPICHSEDGLIEAIHAPSLPSFLFAVQWHPEWKTENNPDSIKIFNAFGQACKAYYESKQK